MTLYVEPVVTFNHSFIPAPSILSPAGIPTRGAVAIDPPEQKRTSPFIAPTSSNFIHLSLPTVDSDNNRLVDSLLSSLQEFDGPRSAAPNAAGQSYVPAGPSPRQAGPGRMRSSIACSRCRRSKVKCVNNGVGTQCRACESAGRECEYPAALAGGHGNSARNRDSMLGRGELASVLAAGMDPERRQRPRKGTQAYVAGFSTGPRESPRPLLDALDPKILTANVWLELLEIYEFHYSADLPFIHSTTFKKPLNAAKSQPPVYNANGALPVVVKPPMSSEFLLAFLALTARFHPKLVAHHSPHVQGRPSNPMLASEYYAEAANERFIPYTLGQSKETIELVQAYLMLGLHEWGASRGWHAWRLVGQAVRTAQGLGLQFDADLDDPTTNRSLPIDNDVDAPEADVGLKSGDFSGRGMLASEDADLFLQQEIRRRTFWSCFILDRYTSSGKYRPHNLDPRLFRVQLPASERKFVFVDRVRTLMLGEDEEQAQQRQLESAKRIKVEKKDSPPRGWTRLDARENKVRLEAGENEGIISRHVKVLDLYGKVLHWACAGGRRTEQHPPWDERSKFAQLRRDCQEFKETLPDTLTLSRNNLQAHIEGRGAAAYMLIHVVHLLCQVYLHREYLPLLPMSQTKPSGPLDEPSFTGENDKVPEGFWEDNADTCFGAARDIIDLITTCNGYCRLAETPIIAFALYSVAFIGVYCITFPEMDPRGHMCTPLAQRTSNPSQSRSPGFSAATGAAELLASLQPRLPMAVGWYRTIRRVGKFLKSAKDAHAGGRRASQGGASSPISDRAAGGGVADGDGSDVNGTSSGDEYKLFERTLADFSRSDLDDVEMADADPYRKTYDDSSSHDTADGRSEDMDTRNGPSPNGTDSATKAEAPVSAGGGSWSAINTTNSNPPSRNASISAPVSNGGFRAYESYPNHSPGPQTSGPTTGQPQQPPLPTHGGFRPAYSSSTPNSAGAPASILSPANGVPITGGSSYEQQRPRGGSYLGADAWNPQTSSSYSAMPPPNQLTPPTSHTSVNSGSHQRDERYASANTNSGSNGYPRGAAQQPGSTSSNTAPSRANNQASASSNAENRHVSTEAWLASLPQALGADDLAAFTDGVEPGLYYSSSNSDDQQNNGTNLPNAASGWLVAVYAN